MLLEPLEETPGGNSYEALVSEVFSFSTPVSDFAN